MSNLQGWTLVVMVPDEWIMNCITFWPSKKKTKKTWIKETPLF